MTAPLQPDDRPGFEELTAQLEIVLEQLERGDLSLDAALATYERGVGLVRQCNDLLDQAELRISELAVSARTQASPQFNSPRFLFNFDTDEDDDEE